MVVSTTSALCAGQFDAIAVPKRGRYVEHPARVEDGTAYRHA